MIVAIMQPYFFPYIGYFQLMHAVDAFVLYDDAQYMKGGWINRNRIRVGQSASWLTLPVAHANFRLPIYQRQYAVGSATFRSILDKLKSAYGQYDSHAEAAQLTQQALAFESTGVAAFNANLLKTIARALGITTTFHLASEVADLSHMSGQDRVLALCGHLGANHYINAIGGTSLYSNAAFQRSGIQLSFLRTFATPVQLEAGPQHLSILDTLFTQGVDGARAALPSYELIDASQCAATGSEAL